MKNLFKLFLLLFSISSFAQNQMNVDEIKKSYIRPTLDGKQRLATNQKVIGFDSLSKSLINNSSYFNTAADARVVAGIIGKANLANPTFTGTVTFNGDVSIPSSNLNINGNIISYGDASFFGDFVIPQLKLSDLNTAPASSSSTGTKGEIRITADYVYICIATNSWRRIAVPTGTF